MKVILSIDPIRYPLTGIGRYTFELVNNLPNVSEDLSLKLLSGYTILNESGFNSHELEKRNQEDSRNTIRQYAHKIPGLVLAHRKILSNLQTKTLSKHNDSILHSPNFYLPKHSGPSVVTIHDLAFNKFPSFHPSSRATLLQKETENAVKKANVIITDSEFTKSEIVAYYGVNRDKVEAIPLASTAGGISWSTQESDEAMIRYGLRENGYSLYIGTIEPRKNIGNLISAYENLPRAARANWPIVMCGYHGWKSKDLHKRITKAEQEGWLKYLGYLAEKDLQILYSNARLFVYPSFYEGFGLPVLEAMASGLPVVCANSSSLPEVVGKAAMMCSPEDVDSLSTLIQEGLENEIWRNSARTLGIERSKKYSWYRCAKETAEVYSRIAV